MNAITGIWEGGHIVLDRAADWPDGCRLVVEPLEEAFGLPEEEWRDSPEAVKEWLAWYHSLEPLEITPEEESEAAQWRRKILEYEHARSPERVKELFA